MADSDEIVNEILHKAKPGFRKAATKLVSDVAPSRAKPEAHSPDLAHMRAKVAKTVRASDVGGGATDAGEVILRVMGRNAADSGAIARRDTRIVKVENDEGQKTRAVLDVTGKKKIGEAS